jgi:hypothetical protein
MNNYDKQNMQNEEPNNSSKQRQKLAAAAFNLQRITRG